MAKFAPPLEGGMLPLRQMRDEDRAMLLAELDAVPGRKALVLEKDFALPLSLVAEAATLREHGVETFCVVEQNPPPISSLSDQRIQRAVYLLRSSLEVLAAACAHARALIQAPELPGLQVTWLLMPQPGSQASRLVQEAGLAADVALRALPLHWVALDDDLLSMEAPAFWSGAALWQDASPAASGAAALLALQRRFGAFGRLSGVGPLAARVKDLLVHAQTELEGPEEGRGPGEAEAGRGTMAFPTPSRIDHAILIDRGSDLVSPLCTQLTYEGLLDEAYGLRCGQVTLSSGAEVAGGKSKVHGLNSGDAVFKQARGKFYVSARRWINETLRTIQQFRDQGIHTADIAEIRGFVAELKETFTRLPQHTALVEALAAVFQSPLFTERAAVEAQLLDGSDALEGVRDLIFRGESLEVVLRLLCLSCVVHGGVPKKAFESLRRDILNAYGHGHLVSLHRLQRAGLLTRGDGRRSSFGLVREAFKLLAHEGQFSPEADPEDIYFAYAGYAPLSVRLVQQCVTKGWKDAPTALQFVPGPTFDLVPDLDDDGHPTMVSYQSQMSTPPKPQAPGRRPLVLVVFLGGVTAAEIAALRFLSAKALVPCDFAVATTRMVTGSTLVSEFLESDPAAASGSQPVNWHGESFPYLMHHPRGAQGPSYRNAEPAHAEAPRRTAHGVWDGPAPRGANVPPSHASDTGAPAPTSRAAPRETLLRTGAKLPLVGLGTYQLDRASAVVEALEAGYRLVDCAAVYANERTVGEGIRAWLAAGGRREELFVIGKIWNDAHRPAEAIQSARQSVEDLGCDYLDCLLVHWPEAWVPGTKEPDAEVTLPQTWAALETLVDGGLVRSLGVSNFSLRQLDELSASARVPPAICQVELHPLLSQRALVGGLRRRGVAPVAYSPLGHGKEGLLATPRVRAVAQELGKSPAQVLLRWNVQREVAVIPKAGSLPHLCENIDVFDFQLSYQHKTALDALDCGKRFVTNDWHVWE